MHLNVQTHTHTQKQSITSHYHIYITLILHTPHFIIHLIIGCAFVCCPDRGFIPPGGKPLTITITWNPRSGVSNEAVISVNIVGGDKQIITAKGELPETKVLPPILL